MFELFFRFIVPTIFLLCTSGVLTLVALKYKITNWITTVLLWAVFGYGLLTTSVIMLGMLGWLSYSSVLILHGVLCLTCMIGFGPTILKKWKTIDHVEKMESIDWLVVSVLFAPVLILALIRTFSAFYQIPIEYDSLAYHLPFVMEWLRTGSLWNVYYSAWAGPLGYYPGTYELVYLWVMLPTKSDIFVNIINTIPLLLFPPTLYRVCRLVGSSKEASLLSVAAFLVMPVVLRQIGTPLVDLFFLWTFLVALLLGLEYGKQKSLVYLYGAAIALGLTLGTKYLGAVYIIPVVTLMSLFLWVGKRPFWKKGAHQIALLSTTFLVGGFWYIRNWVDSGNPLFPTEISLFGKVWFEGYLGITDNLVSTSLAQNIPSIKPIVYFVDHIFLMIGAHFYLYIALFFLFFLVFLKKIALLFWHKEKQDKKKEGVFMGLYLLLLFGIVLYGLGYWFSPYSFKDLIPNVRYALPCVVLMAIVGSIVMTELSVLRVGFYMLLTASIGYNIVYLVLFPPLALLPNERFMVNPEHISFYGSQFAVFLLLVVIGIAIIYTLKKIFKHPRETITLTLLCAIFGLTGLIFIQQTVAPREQLRSQLYTEWYGKTPEWLHIADAAEWLNTFAPQAKIAYTGFNMHYPLFGRTTIREVDYVNINECLSCRYVDYKSAKDSIRSFPNKDAWIANLKKLQKEYIVIKNIGPRMYERVWMQESPDQFQLVFSRGDIEIYSYH